MQDMRFFDLQLSFLTALAEFLGIHREIVSMMDALVALCRQVLGLSEADCVPAVHARVSQITS